MYFSRRWLLERYKRIIVFECIKKARPYIILPKGSVIMIGFLIALISGALMSIQGVWNAGFSKQTNLWASACVIQISAFFVCLIMMVITKSTVKMEELLLVRPRYFLLGGALGALITVTVVKGISALGPAKAEMLIVSSQIVIAYLIEIFGLFQVERKPFELRSLFGMVLFVIGIVIFRCR